MNSVHTYNSEIEKQAELGLCVDLALVAAGVGLAQVVDAQRVHGAGALPALVARGEHGARRARRRRLRARHARVRREHVARVRQDLQVTRPHPRHLDI